MCDYRLKAKLACSQMPKEPIHLLQHIGAIPSRVLIQSSRIGLARTGCCLYSGKRLPPAEISQSHYMLPAHWQQHLAQLNADPTRCGWCSGGLPSQQINEHLRPHVHREQLEHHFHEQPGCRCFSARLVAIAMVFGDLTPDLLRRVRIRRRRQKRTISVVGVLQHLQTVITPQRLSRSNFQLSALQPQRDSHTLVAKRD